MISTIDQKHFIFRNKVEKAVLFLSARRILWQIVQTISSVILARIFFPADFGIFALILFYINIFTLIADVGFFGSLIQKDKEPTESQLKSIFTSLLFLGLLVMVLMWLISPIFFSFYRFELTTSNYELLILSAIVPLLFNLRIISSSLLERKLDYKRLTIGEIFELVIQNASTITLALVGYGVKSFLIGLILSRMSGAIMFYVLSPWKIGLRTSYRDLRPYLKFGRNFQINTLIGTIGGAIAPLVVGGISGTYALGLINWAGGVGSLPRSIGEVLGRLIFSAGSRVQKDKVLFAGIFEKSLEVSVMITFPLIAIIIALAYPIVYIVFTGRWIDGVGALYIFTFQSAFVVLGMLLTNGLMALGGSREVKNITIFSTILQWFLAMILVKKYGFIGFPISGLISSASFLLSLREIGKKVKISFLSKIIPYIYFSTIIGFVTFSFAEYLIIDSLLELILSALVGILSYSVFLIIFKRDLVLSEIKRFYRVIKLI